MTVKEIQISVRVSPEMAERIDQLAVALKARALGVEVTRASATRAAVERGVAELEKELGMRAPETKSEPPKRRK